MTFDSTIIRNSHHIIDARGDEFADKFFQNLLFESPGMRAALKDENADELKKGLLANLRTFVDHLDDSEVLVRLILDLGAAGAKHNLQKRDVEAVGGVLLATMRDFLGESWDGDHQRNWQTVLNALLDALSERMKNTSGFLAAQTTPKADSAPSEMNQPKDRVVLGSIVLPQQIKQQIHEFVESSVRDLIRNEIAECYQEQIDILEKMSVEDLIRLAS